MSRGTKKKKPEALIVTRYRKVMKWVYAAIIGFSLWQFYKGGIIAGLTPIVGLFVLDSIIQAGYQAYKYAMKSEDNRQLRRRVIAIGATVSFFAAVFVITKYVFLPSGIGQSLQQMMWGGS